MVFQQLQRDHFTLFLYLLNCVGLLLSLFWLLLKSFYSILDIHLKKIYNSKQLRIFSVIAFINIVFQVSYQTINFVRIQIIAPMGIHKLMDLLRSNAPDSIKKRDIKYFSGMSLALDASMSMYQFLVSTQGISTDSNFLTSLTDAQGNKTGHLLGLFNRTLLLIENGIKPVWVFDGKAPTKKNGELLRRRKIKEEAIQKKQQAEDIGNLAEALKQQQRTTYISKKEREDVMHMLRLMGIPVIQAPGEAEAQCSYMNKIGKVDAVCTEDTDCLVFGATTMVRDVNNKKEPLTEINRSKAMEDLNLTDDEFIDMCILCGCDYASKIEGIGPVKAYKFIKQFHTIENILDFCKNENEKQGKIKYVLPKQEDFSFEEARQLFKKPLVTDDYELKWEKNIDQEALRKFLCVQKGFAESRIDGAVKKLKSNKGTQSRLQSFFGKPTVIKSSTAHEELKKKGTKKK